MIYLIPFLNAAFGWFIIAALLWFLFHPHQKKNIFIVELQGMIPKKLPELGQQLGSYTSRNFINFGKLKEDLLAPGKLAQVHTLLEGKVDDFLRNKLKDKIPIFGMFVTDGLISQMKDILMKELEHMIPDLITFFANDLEKKYDVQKLITEKLSQNSAKEMEEAFYRQAGKGIFQLKVFCATIGFGLGWLEVLLTRL